MARYERVMTNYIKSVFDGLSKSQQNELVNYYFENFGGAGGCEECYETWSLCEDCYNALQRKARKMTDILQ